MHTTHSLARSILHAAGLLSALAACGLPVAHEDEVALAEQAIVGGTDSTTDAYPSMVSLETVYADGSFDHWCGGTLIAPQWVLTAKHCFVEADGTAALPAITHAVIGLSDLIDDGGEIIAIQPSRVVLHPSVDVALVRLASASRFGVTARLASTADTGAFAPGDRAFIAGWGFDGFAHPTLLQHAEVAIVDAYECQDQWLPGGEDVTEHEICAGTPDGSRDAGRGDSGGPLFVRDAAGYLLAGVTSWGDNDFEDDYTPPGVYVRVDRMLDFIQASTTDAHPAWYAAAGRAGFASNTLNATSVAWPLVGDFDSDGRDDVIYYVPGQGKDSLRYGTGRSIPLVMTRSYTPLVGDFDGDGYDDVAFYGIGSAPDSMWWGGTKFTSAAWSVSGTFRPVVGDFDADGRDDIFWYGAGSAADSLWWGNANRTFTVQSRSVAGDYRPLAGDFDGDGRDDVLWYGPGDRADAIWWANAGRAFTTGTLTVARSYRPAVGDFDADGRDDVFWYGVSSTADEIWYGEAARRFTKVTTSVGGRYLPYAANLDGRRGDDVLWYRGAPAKGF